MRKNTFKFIAILSLFAVLMAGCSSTKDEVVKADKSEVYEEGQTVDVSSLKITMENAKLLAGDGKDDSVIQFNMKVTNGSADVKSFTSLSLVVKNKAGKELDIYPAENIGSDIKAGKTISGPGFYKVDGKGPYKVTYIDPDTKKAATWEMSVTK